MPPGIGYRFQPGIQDTQLNGDDGAGRASGLSPQQAVEIRSLRIPDRPSPTAIAPLALLNSPGGGAAGAQGLDSLIAALMQVFQPQAAQAGPQAPPLPTAQPTAPPPVDQDYLRRAQASTPESRAARARRDAEDKARRERGSFKPRIIFQPDPLPDLAQNPGGDVPGLF